MIVSLSHRAIAQIFCITVLGVLLPGCAGETSGTFLESVVAPDEQLQQSANSQDPSDSLSVQPCSDNILSQLPEGFPDLLCYPDATLVESENLSPVSQADDGADSDTEKNSTSGTLSTGTNLQTRWTTNQPVETIQEFYQAFFDEGEWQVTRLPNELDNSGILQALKGSERITVRFSNFFDQETAGDRDLISISRVQPVEYTVNYRESTPFTATAVTRADSEQSQGEVEVKAEATTGTGSETDRNDAATIEDNPETANEDNNLTAPETSSAEIADVDRIPAELKDYVEAGIALGIFEDGRNPLASENGEGDARTPQSFRPNQPITRREFARWLVQANNRLYASESNKQIRAARPLSQPVFRDVSQADPDFGVIQGLAEAGLIPSSLSGDTETDYSLFKGDVPLTRETLIAWKIPLDVHRALPPASVSTIENAWGFQDADTISASALSAIATDHQNGDRSALRRAFGYTLLFQPQRSVTRAEAAAALWHFGTKENGVSATELLERQADGDSPLELNSEEQTNEDRTNQQQTNEEQ